MILLDKNENTNAFEVFEIGHRFYSFGAGWIFPKTKKDMLSAI